MATDHNFKVKNGLHVLGSEGVYLTDTNTRLHEGNGNALRISTGTGYVDLGSMNSSWVHFQANKNIYILPSTHVSVDGHLYPYTDSTRTLGGNTVRWSHTYTDNITVTDDVTIGGTISSGPITVTSDSSTQRALYIDQAANNTGNIIQFRDENSANIWEVVGRENGFYIYKNTGTGSGYKYQISTSGTHTFTGSQFTFNDGFVAVDNRVEITNTTDNAGIKLISANTAVSYVDFGDPEDSNIGLIAYDHSVNNMFFKTNASEAMRIDTSGNVLVGKTSNSYSTAGAALGATGSSNFTRDGNPPVGINRLSSDGSIINFAKDSSTIGSIGTVSSTLTIGSGDTGILFNASSNAVYPWNLSTNNASDGLIDLGISSRRWKDLHLSGTANVGTINTGQGATEVYLMNQNVRSSDSPTFADLTVTGNLNITGDINSYNVTDLDVTDKTITLGVGGSASVNNGAGIIIDGAGAELTWSNSSARWTMNKSLQFSDDPTTTNQAMGVFWPGFDKEGTTDYTDNAKIIHTTNTGGHAGSVLLIESQNDANDGIAFVTPSSSYLKHNSSNILTAANAFGQLGITATATELNYTDGVTSNIQTQLNNKIESSYTGFDSRYYTESELQTYFRRGYIESQTANALAVGWYTVATNTGDRAIGDFTLWDTDSSDHQGISFKASHFFGTDNSNDLTVLHYAKFSGSPIRYIRIKDGGTYDGAALQVYIDQASNNVGIAITGGNPPISGWVLKDWIPDATDPGDLSNYGSFGERVRVDLDLISNGGQQTSGAVVVGNPSNVLSDTSLSIYQDSSTADQIKFYDGTTRVGEIGTQDTTWLRINNVTNKNIYTPRYIRADNGFFVGNTNTGLTSSGNLIGIGTIGCTTITTTGLTANYNSTANISLSPTSTGGVINARNSSGTSVVVMDGRGTPFIDVTGNLKTGGTTRIDSSGNLSNIGTISSGGIVCTPYLNINASGTSDTRLEVGASTSSNHYAYIDLIGDSTYTDYGLRIIRGNGGANTTSELHHRGTGNFNIIASDSASIRFNTNGSNALTIDNSQNVGIGIDSPFSKLQVGGHTFSGGNGMYENSRVGISNHGNLTGMMLASTYNNATYPEYGLVFVQGPSTSSYNVWSISPDGPAKGDSLNFIYGSNATNIHVATPKVVFDGNGNVGIGITSPSNKLDVVGHIEAGSFEFNALSGTAVHGTGLRVPASQTMSLHTNSQERMRIDSSGNVGIGTTSPNEILHVSRGSSGSGLLLENSAGGSGEYITLDFNTYNVDQANFANAAASIRVIDDGAYSGDITFRTKGAAINAAQTEKMRIDGATGNVGIGTTNPIQKLQVVGSIYANTGSIFLDSGQRLKWGNSQQFIEATNSGPMELGTGNAVRMVILNGGNVGINKSSPASKLHIHGTQSYGSLRISPTSANGESAMAFFLDTAGTQTSNAWVVGHAGWGNTGDFVIGNQAFGGPVMLMQQDGNVGIGTTSPRNNLDIVDSDGKFRITSYGPYFHNVTDSSNERYIHARADGKLSIGYVAIANLTGGTGGYATTTYDHITIGTSGNVGIGTSSPANHINTGSFFKPDSNGKFLTLNGGANGSFIMLESSTTTDDDQIGGVYWTRTQGQGDAHKQVAGIDVIQVAYGPNNLLEGGTMRFFTKPSASGSTTARMVLDHSGNLLVGKTSTSQTVEGIVLQGADGRLNASADGNVAGIFNRLTNDGDIFLFRKDGSTVGSIGTRIGDITIGTGDTGLRFSDGGDSILPAQSGSSGDRDAAIDLGATGARFKNLYLSGTVSASTLAANALTVNGQPVIDSARNMSNIGSASTGAHTINGSANSNYILFKVSGSNKGCIGIGDTTASNIHISNSTSSTSGTGIRMTTFTNVNNVSPCYGNGTLTNNLTNLGTSSARWKNIYAGSNIYAGADVVAYSSSDERLKDNLERIQQPIEKIQKISGYEFDWNDNQDTFEGHDIGVVAQEVEKVLPEIVETRENGYKAVKYEKMVALLIEGMKEQQEQIKELQEQVQELSKQK